MNSSHSPQSRRGAALLVAIVVMAMLGGLTTEMTRRIQSSRTQTTRLAVMLQVQQIANAIAHHADRSPPDTLPVPHGREVRVTDEAVSLHDANGRLLAIRRLTTETSE